MSDVFISYSRENQEVVRRLAEKVQGLGYNVWWDDQLPPHLSYGDVIAQKVGGAKAAIVVWSANAVESEWVRAEADMARNQKKLIQTSIDGRDPPMPFNQLHYVSLADWDGNDGHPGWEKVKESLAALCAPPAAEATAPPVVPAAPPVPPVVPPAPPAAAPIALEKAAPPPAPAAAPPPPPAPAPSAAPAPTRKGGSNKLIFILIGVSLLVIAAVVVLALTRSRSSEPEGNNVAPVNELRPAEPGPETPPVEIVPAEFSQEAVISDEDGFANVRGGPSVDAAIVARVNTGETFNTYRQDGDWWRVRIAGGLVGYMERSRIRVREPVAVPSLAEEAPTVTPTAPGVPVLVPPAGTPQVAPPRRSPVQRPPRRVGPRLNEENSGVLREFCKNAGAGTPECRRVGLGGRRR